MPARLPDNVLPITRPLDEDVFTVHEGVWLIAEASDFGPAGFTNALQRLFNDAADQGIGIRSHPSGRIVRFALDRVEKDREGDVTAWVFQVVPRDAKASTVRHVRVFND